MCAVSENACARCLHCQYTVDNAVTLFMLDQLCVQLSDIWHAMLQEHSLYSPHHPQSNCSMTNGNWLTEKVMQGLVGVMDFEDGTVSNGVQGVKIIEDACLNKAVVLLRSRMRCW